MTSMIAFTWTVVAMAAPADGSSPLASLGFMAVMLAVMYAVLIYPMQRRQKKVQQFQNSLKVGDRVITTGGIYGTIEKIADRTVKVKIADKVNIEISKAAIAGLQGQDPVVADNTQA